MTSFLHHFLTFSILSFYQLVAFVLFSFNLQISKITKSTAIDDWGLRSKPILDDGYKYEKYLSLKNSENFRLNQTKVNQWAGDLRDKLSAADAFGIGHVPSSDIRRIVTHVLNKANVHHVEQSVEEILFKSDDVGDGVHHDQDVLVG